jgi:hypothetical protein
VDTGGNQNARPANPATIPHNLVEIHSLFGLPYQLKNILYSD